MKGDEADEVLEIVQRIGPVILSSAVSLAGDLGTSLRRAVGMLIADKNVVDPDVLAYAMTVCLELARLCDATLVTMDRVRKAALTEVPKYPGGTQTVLIIVRTVLATESRIIASTVFRSRDDVDKTATQINEAFDQTVEIAADDLDAGTYMLLVRLHGDVTSYLADRGRQLPRVIEYRYQMVMPALRMSQRAYGTGARYRELIDENHVVHPAFMPMRGRMLAV